MYMFLFTKAVLRNRNQNHSICFGRYLCWTLVGPRSLVSSSAVMTYQFIKVMGCEDEEMLHKDLVPSHRLLSADPGRGRRRMLRTNQRGTVYSFIADLVSCVVDIRTWSPPGHCSTFHCSTAGLLQTPRSKTHNTLQAVTRSRYKIPI